ncbi:leucine-rich repeat-containing protein 25 [Dipodomys merriami]|uniref:leucine-rich repeat-containing protein 25 n=1 Tax=Dipodomys merriami TaxID=94247 RepID=UPI0038557C12
MAVPAAWALLPLLQALAGRGLACAVVSGEVDWAAEVGATCLNLSGRGVRLPRERPLRAPRLRVLDLSHNGLRELPPAFFAELEELRSLDVAGNPLVRVAASLAAHCGLELRADCGCALAAWHRARRDNCSDPGPLQCVLAATGAAQNLSAFLEARCASGLAPATVAAAAAGGLVFLGLLAAGSVLAWRLRGPRGPAGRGKGQGAQDRAGPGSQPRYSSRDPRPMPPSSAPDYENVFIGQTASEPQWTSHGASEDCDFYMNYEGPSADAQAVYCNLESLGRALTDEEEYVAPGR